MAPMLRRDYLDWLRGLAVLTMILWHSLDAWTDAASRHGKLFYVITFIGGWAAPLFLFLAGISIAFSRSPNARGWQVFLLALLFRFQSFVLNPGAPWISMLKPDILNILGLGIVVVGTCRSRAASALGRALWLLVPAAGVVLLTPWSRSWQWPALLGTL